MSLVKTNVPLRNVQICVSLPRELLDRLGKVTKNRSAYISEALREKLHKVDERVEGLKCEEKRAREEELELTDREKRHVVKAASQIGDLIDVALVSIMKEKKDFLQNMSDKDLAQLVVSRLPKVNADGGEIEEEVLSLKGCIDSLPGISDLTQELNDTKGQLMRLKLERDAARSQLRYFRGRDGLLDLMKNLYNQLIEFVVDMIARNDLPGVGEGGGLSGRGYQRISDRVKTDFHHLRIMGLEKET